MKHRTLIAFFLIVFNNTKCQEIINKDSLAKEICNSFKYDQVDGPDSLKLKRIFIKHMSPVLSGAPQDTINRIFDYLYIRLQRQCKEFGDYLDKRKKGITSNWTSIDYEPESKISSADSTFFFSRKFFKYLEANGDTVNLLLNDSIWEDHFLDKSYSKLSLHKVSKSVFIIRFIESNNKIRKDFSKLGDEYRYIILDRKETYFSMFVQPKGSDRKMLFKLYY